MVLSPIIGRRPVAGAQSIERATRLLQLLGAHHAEGIALQRLVEASGLDRTTAYRIVSSLVRAGLAEREPGSGLYRLGLESMALGMVSMQRPPLVAQCRPMMKVVARRAGEPVFLVVRSGDHSHCLWLEEGPRPIRTFVETVGSTRLLGLGVPSFTLLARMADAEVDAHHARHAAEYLAQGMSLAKLQRWVRQTREQDYAQVTAKGMGGVGVRFALGSCADAALGIVTAASRVPRARWPGLVELMREELRRLA